MVRDAGWATASDAAQEGRIRCARGQGLAQCSLDISTARRTAIQKALFAFEQARAHVARWRRRWLAVMAGQLRSPAPDLYQRDLDLNQHGPGCAGHPLVADGREVKSGGTKSADRGLHQSGDLDSVRLSLSSRPHAGTCWIADAGIMRAAEIIRSGVRDADVMAEIVATVSRCANCTPGIDFPSRLFCSSPSVPGYRGNGLARAIFKEIV